MHRHITDKTRDREDSPRVREYLKIDRQANRSDAAKALHEQPHGERSTTQLREFLRIARGRTA